MFSLKNIDVVDFSAQSSNEDFDLIAEEQLHHVLFENAFNIDEVSRNEQIPFRVQENKNVITEVPKLGDDLVSDKKVMHRDIERQRRREMSNLYESLRSLLPSQYIKGKRSTSDHMREAVNYIKDTQKNIENLRRNRDNLRKAISSCSNEAENSNICAKRVNITLNSYGHGAEILINTTLVEEEGRGFFRLSRIMKELNEMGHNVVSCVSTKAHGGVVHRIELEGNDIIKKIDLSKVEERLSYVINS